MRSQAEIRARFDRIRTGDEPDVFGFKGEAIIETLERATIADLIEDDLDWDELNLRESMIDYLAFAIDKAYNHRGISATRSIERFSVWLWCWDDADLIDRFDSENYAPYGAPQLNVLVGHFGVGSLPEETRHIMETEAWQRMAQGNSCTPDCREGCMA